MTRETKIGMIVAGSFLSLVGVVVGTKLLKHDLPDNTAPQTLVSNSGEPKKNPPPPGSAAPTGAKPPEEIKLAEFKTPKTLPPLAPQGPGLPPSLPDPNLPSIPTAPTIPAAPVDDTTARLQALKAAQEKELHHGDTHPPVVDASKLPVSNGIATLPPANDLFPTPPLSRTGTQGIVVAQGPESKGKATAPPPAGGIDPPPPLPAAPAPSPITSPPSSSAPKGTPPPPAFGGLPPPPTPPTDPIAPIPSAPIGSTPVPPPPSEAVAKNPVPPPPGVTPKTPAPPAPFTSAPPPPAPITTAPPLVAPTAPSVVVGDEKRYVVKPADSYASVSRTVYGDDRYAAALEAYNHSRLGAGAPATLQPGAEIVIPTAASLQNSRFGVLIAATPTPPPVPPAPPAAPTYPPIATSPAALAPIRTVPPAPPFPTPAPAVVTPSLPPPPPLANRDPVTIGPVTSPSPRPATTPVPAGVTTYRIPAGGLLIAQVAQQQLGSPLRWIDIYRLNSNLDPSRPIPEGTEIRLPPR